MSLLKILITIVEIICYFIIIWFEREDGQTKCEVRCEEDGLLKTSPWCPVESPAHCECDSGHIAECRAPDRRRLQTVNESIQFTFNDSQVPFMSECVLNDTCRQLLVGYSLGQSAQERWDEIGLTGNVSELFEYVIEEIEENAECSECECNTTDPMADPTSNTPTTSSPTTSSPTTSDPTLEPTCNQDKYIVVDDGIERTWQEAREFCYDEYGTDLATITDVNDTDLQCAVRNLNTSAWTGIYSRTNGTYCYEFTNGEECPMLDTCECVTNNSWLYGEPLLSMQASQCVHYIPTYQKLHNDISCGEKIYTLVCNAISAILQISQILTSFCSVDCPNGSTQRRCLIPDVAECWCDSWWNPNSGCRPPPLG